MPKKIMLAQSIKATQFSGPCRCDIAMGIPIPKTLVIWASPVTLTLTQVAKVI